jgi:hypothetical protein
MPSIPTRPLFPFQEEGRTEFYELRLAPHHLEDAGEAIEISGPAGTDVTGWQVVLYNGTGGASYDTKTLSGAFPVTCTTRGVIVINYPTNGIQNVFSFVPRH